MIFKIFGLSNVLTFEKTVDKRQLYLIMLHFDAKYLELL